MSDTLAAVERLLEKANELRNGPQRIGVLEQAVRNADQHGHLDAAFRARLKLCDAAAFGGRPDVLLTAYNWCLAAHDSDPDCFEQQDLLWKFKWVVGHVVEFPTISRGQIESMLADMADRFAKAGSTMHAVHQSRREILADMGDDEGAAAAAAELAATKRDWLSDCRACIHDISAGHLAIQGRDGEALAEAAPILAGRVKCTHVPHRTYSKLLLPLLRLGRVEEAQRHHQKGYRLIGDNPDFLAAAGLHLDFLTLTGNLDQAIAALEGHLPNALSTPSIFSRMHFYGAALFLLEALRDEGEAALRLRSPSAFPLFNAKGVYDLAATLKWCGTEVETMVGQFDARNGNAYYARWLAGRKNLMASDISPFRW